MQWPGSCGVNGLLGILDLRTSMEEIMELNGIKPYHSPASRRSEFSTVEVSNVLSSLSSVSQWSHTQLRALSISFEAGVTSMY